MRIMFVSDQYPPMIGGVPQLTRGLASDLVKRGHQVWVIAPNYGVRDSQRVEQGCVAKTRKKKIKRERPLHCS